MPRPRSAPDLYLLSKVSTLYYLRDRTQQEIADRLRISRPTVSRLLQEAQAQGIVRITVVPPNGLLVDLESRLEAGFGLVEAQVVAAERRQGADMLRRQIAAAAAAYLTRTVQRGETIGLAWGTTLSEMVNAMALLPTDDVRVVQLLGGIGPPEAEAYAASITRGVAQRLGAAPVVLAAPGIVATPGVRDALGEDPHIRVALKQYDALDTAFVGIGSLASNPLLTDGRTLPPAIYRELVAARAIGDIALRFFDASGSFVRTSLDDRLLGVTAEQLRNAKRVVAVAGGPEKVDAICAALGSGIIDVLVTDQITAEALATRCEPPARRR